MAWDVVLQVTDCRRLADDLGWTVAEKYLDNYPSAFSKRRSSNERVLAGLVEGPGDAVVATRGGEPKGALTRPAALAPLQTPATAARISSPADGRTRAAPMTSLLRVKSRPPSAAVGRTRGPQADAGGGCRYRSTLDAD